MKIGVMTFWWSEDNYGQLLQCYALQKYLRDKGHDAYLIRYDHRKDFTKLSYWRKILRATNPVWLYKYLLNKKRKIVDKYEKTNNPRKFEEFRSKYLKQTERIYYSYNQLVEDPPLADVYIAGSDQIWNTFSLPTKKAINILNAFFLNFGDPSIKRISYAASFGKEKVDNDFLKEVSALLRNFDYVSVREKSGLDICKQCGLDNVEWVPDPTILLDVNIYRALYREQNIKKQDKPYLFLYLLENDSNFSIKRIYNWAKNKNIEVVYISGNMQQSNYKKTHPTIPEWIYLLEFAEYVITNSFHCTVFSLMFSKKFGIIPRAGKNIYANCRFESIFQLLELENRFINFNYLNLDVPIDWQSVSRNYQNIRSKCNLNDIIINL